MSVLWTRYASDSVSLVDLQDGKSRVTLQYFYKTSADASAPTVPQGNFEYNFLSGVLTPSISTAFANWSTVPDSLSFSEALWMVSITLEGPVGSTATFDDGDWNGPVVLSRVGFQPTQPDPATSVATVFIFRPKGAASNGAVNAPTKTPTGPFSYDFETGALSPITVDEVTGDLDGWSQDLPAIVPGQYIWVKQATASSTSGTDIINGDEFSAPTLLSGSGLDGYNTAVVQLYNKNSDASSAPPDPEGDFKHTFSSGLLTAESGADFNGWTQKAPSITNGEYLWIIQGSAVSRGSTDIIAAGEFGAAQIVGVGGENAQPPSVSTSYNASTGVTTVTVGDTSFDITDGSNGTSEGVLVVYADDASGTNKNFVRQTGQEYVLYYEWVDTKPTINEISGTWIKFVGETPNAPDAQGIIPIYANRANPTQDSHTFISHADGRNWITFLEYTGTRPTSVPSGTHNQTFVPFVGSNGDPAGRYSTFRAYSTTSTTPPTGTITWATGNVVLDDTTNWSLSAPTVAVSPSTTVYWSDLVFVDSTGVAATTEDTGSAVQTLINFNGVVTFTNSESNDVIISDGTSTATVLADGGTTEINGGRISANSISLGTVQNSTSQTSGDQSSMVLDNDTITINDSDGNPRVILGKLT